MKRLLLGVVLLLTAGAAASSAAGGGPGAAAYTVTDLRPLLAGIGVPANFVVPTAISPGGLIVGTWDDESFCHTTQSFLFTPSAPNSPTGTMRDIGNFGASAFKATGVNDAGEVSIASENDIQCSAAARFAFVWHDGGLATLSDSGAANAINALGQVAGNDSGRAARWIDGGLLALDNGFSNAFAINNAGHVVGNSNGLPNVPANGDAFFWDGGMHDLGRLPGFDESTALAINDGDVVAGESSQVNRFSHAFVYSGGVMHDIDCDTRGRAALGCTGPGTGGSSADGINNAGQVVGEENGRAFLWDSAGGMVDLNSLVPADVNDTLTNAVAINDRGQIIATGASSSYLLTPAATPPAAPELTSPADGALFNSSGVTVTGTGVPGATVHILVDGTEVGTTVVAADGGISYFFRHDDGKHTLTATQELDGLVSAPTAPRTFTIDTLPPLVTCGSADGAWHPGNVSIGCTAVDTGSGLANASDGSFSLATSVASGDETANASTGSHQVCDLAGNCVTAGPIGGNMVDRKAPVVTCGTADGVWHNTNVTIGCTASDGGSGVTSTAFDLSTSVPPDTADANASTNSVDVCDAVGNCATAGPIGGNMIDRTSPTLALPANVTTTNPVVTYSVTATDPDEIALVVSCSPASGSTFPVGTTTVQCTATDRAKNTATGSFTVTVAPITKTPLQRLTEAVNAIGNANLKAHVRNLAQVGGNGYCSQLKVIAAELSAINPQTATTADALDAAAALQRAAGCSR